MLKETYGENSLSHAHVFEWYKWFSEGRENIEDDQHPGRPDSVSTSQTVTNINETVCADRHMSIRMIAETVSTNKETRNSQKNFTLQIEHEESLCEVGPKKFDP